MGTLVGVGLVFLVLLVLAVVPLILVAAVVGILLRLLILPFKLLGFGLQAGVGLAGFLLKSAFLLVGFVLLVLLSVGLLPLIPILLVGAGIYLVTRPSHTAAPPIG